MLLVITLMLYLFVLIFLDASQSLYSCEDSEFGSAL